MKYQSTPGLAFALLRSVIGPATSRLSLNQSDPELKPITVARLGSLVVFYSSSSRWFLKVVSFLLIGCFDNLWFWFHDIQSKSAQCRFLARLNFSNWISTGANIWRKVSFYLHEDCSIGTIGS